MLFAQEYKKLVFEKKIKDKGLYFHSLGVLFLLRYSVCNTCIVLVILILFYQCDFTHCTFSEEPTAEGGILEFLSYPVCNQYLFGRR